MLLVYMAAMVLWAARPWTDTHALVATPDREPAFAEYKCPSVFRRTPIVRGRQILGGQRPEGQERDPVFPVDGTPCGQRRRQRVLFVVDIAAAGVGLALLKRSGSRHQAADRLHEAEATALEAAST